HPPSHSASTMRRHGPRRADASLGMLGSLSCSSDNPPVWGDGDQFALVPSMRGDKTLKFPAKIRVLSPGMFETGEIGGWGDHLRDRIEARSNAPNRPAQAHPALALRARL